jgi:hypothetical protein
LDAKQDKLGLKNRTYNFLVSSLRVDF